MPGSQGRKSKCHNIPLESGLFLPQGALLRRAVQRRAVILGAPSFIVQSFLDCIKLALDRVQAILAVVRVRQNRILLKLISQQTRHADAIASLSPNQIRRAVMTRYVLFSFAGHDLLAPLHHRALRHLHHAVTHRLVLLHHRGQ
jgi:hypothetical protein